jgi:hypothetical protein
VRGKKPFIVAELLFVNLLFLILKILVVYISKIFSNQDESFSQMNSNINGPLKVNWKTTSLKAVKK